VWGLTLVTAKAGCGKLVNLRIKTLPGLLLLLLGTTACAGIIEVVPNTPPTPPATATPLARANPAKASEAQQPVRIVAKTIDLDAPVVAMGWRAVEQGGAWVSQWDMPENEAAWHRNTAWPGRGSNIVISGHNASTGGQVFAQLDDLQIGDEITLFNHNQETFTYQLVEKNIVRTFASSAETERYLRTVTEPTNQEQLTLITCWPRWTNTHRLIVIAQPK